MNLVTGAAGHLGNVLVRALLERDEKVRALILPGENTTSLEGLPIERMMGNILDPASLEPACQGITTIFHMAGLVALMERNAPALQMVNVEGTRHMIQAASAAGVQKFIYTSSIHALTRPPDGIQIDESQPFDPINPAGPYDRTKAAASIAVQEAAARGLHAVIVCPTGVIGPYDYRRSEMGEMFLAWMLTPINWLVKGAFDFVDVRDVAEGHIRARDHGRPGETYILGGKNIEVIQLCGMVASQAGLRQRIIALPRWIALAAAHAAEKYYEFTRTRPRFTRYSLETIFSKNPISSRKAQVELGYRPRSLYESVADTVTWWLENQKRVKASVRI